MASQSLRICIQMYYARESLPFLYQFYLKIVKSRRLTDHRQSSFYIFLF